MIYIFSVNLVDLPILQLQGDQIVRFFAKVAVLEALVRPTLSCDPQPLVLRFLSSRSCRRGIFKKCLQNAQKGAVLGQSAATF